MPDIYVATGSTIRLAPKYRREFGGGHAAVLRSAYVDYGHSGNGQGAMKFRREGRVRVLRPDYPSHGHFATLARTHKALGHLPVQVPLSPFIDIDIDKNVCV
jgi:hypothetical protein